MIYPVQFSIEPYPTNFIPSPKLQRHLRKLSKNPRGYHRFSHRIVFTTLGVAATVLSLLGLLWYHIGADETKVWIKFGRVFYREIKFSELTALKLVVNRLKLYAGKTIINIEPGRFNYSVVYYGLLKELQTRRFELPNNTQPNDPNWEEDAQYWRNLLAERIFVNHSEFFRGNPVELAYLNSLICPPGL